MNHRGLFDSLFRRLLNLNGFYLYTELREHCYSISFGTVIKTSVVVRLRGHVASPWDGHLLAFTLEHAYRYRRSSPASLTRA